MQKERRNKFYWVLYVYLVFLGVFLIYYQVRVHKLENKLKESNSELRYDADEVLKDIENEFYFNDVEMEKLKERIRELEKESIPEQIIHYKVALRQLWFDEGTFVSASNFEYEGFYKGVGTTKIYISNSGYVCIWGDLTNEVEFYKTRIKYLPEPKVEE